MCDDDDDDEKNENTDLLCRLTSYKNLLCATHGITLNGSLLRQALALCIVRPSMPLASLMCTLCADDEETAHYVLVCMCTHIFAKPGMFYSYTYYYEN